MSDFFFAKSENKIEKGSIFQAFAVNVTAYHDTQLTYMQMKKCYRGMKHIVKDYELRVLRL